MTDTKIKIIIAGDLLPSGKNVPLFEQGDAKQLFGEDICNLFTSADYSIINLEGPLTDSNNGQTKAGPVIKAPSKTINGIKALGVKAVSLANNHTTDYGNEGYEDTIKQLESAHISHIGSGKNEAHISHYKCVELRGKKLCFYCVSETFFNEPTPIDAGAHLYDEYLVCKEIKELKKSNDYVIVLYHGGAEYLQYPTPATRKRFLRMAESGADFITAQHTHCIGCVEQYGSTYMLHGQGNFLFARQKKYPNLTKEGLVAELIMDGENVDIKLHRVYITKDECLRLDSADDFSAMKERSKNVANIPLIEDLYKQLKYEELAENFLSAYQGNHFFHRLYKKIFPKQFKNYLVNAYTRQQLYKCWTPVRGERRKEDLYYFWKYLIELKEPTK